MTSYQLYSSRNFPPLAATLEMLADAGFGEVEGFGGLYATPAQLAEMAAGLAANGLTMPTGHFGLAQLEAEPEFVLEIARRLGTRHIYCPYVMPDDRPKDSAGWRAFGARLQAAGKPFRAAGLDFGWHNHDFEMVACADGVVPIDAIFEGGPDLSWEMDVAWVLRGGADPLAWIARYKDRITAAHVKDIARAGENRDEDGWADLGQGVVPWGPIKAALVAAGVKNFVLEHDNPSDHARFARRSIAAFEAL